MITAADILRGKVLIVDDQRANVLLLERMLTGAGYTSISSTMDPSEVCELHLRHRYDLILLDVQMPSMDGFQVMENLKEIEAGSYLPVLVITAQPDHKLRALKAGAKDFVSKPFDIAEVLIRVHNMLEVRLLHQKTRQLYERVAAEQLTSERLLVRLLPAPLAERLKGRLEITADGVSGLIAESFAEVTVLFADLVEFTKFSEGVGAEVMVNVLQQLSTRSDGDLDPTRIVGDAYLGASSLPDPVADRTIGAANRALEVVAALDRFNEHSRYQLKVRIGMVTATDGANTRSGAIFVDL